MLVNEQIVARDRGNAMGGGTWLHYQIQASPRSVVVA